LLVISLLIGILLLYFGAELLVKGASKLAFNLGVTPLAIGLTVVSMSTSMPEGVASLIAQLEGARGDIAIGNIIGSNIANIGLVLGITLLIRPIKISPAIKQREMPIMLFISIFFIALMTQLEISRFWGGVLVSGLLVYLIMQWKLADKGHLNEDKIVTSEFELKKGSLKDNLLDLLLIGVGLVMLVIGGHLLISSAITLAEIFGISERVIGITLVAVGTSLPELATSIVASLRKASDISIGNVVGSNIFNLLFIIGGVSLVIPIAFSEALLWKDAPIMLAFSVVLWAMMWTRNVLDRRHGVMLLAGYCLYITYLFVG